MSKSKELVAAVLPLSELPSDGKIDVVIGMTLKELTSVDYEEIELSNDIIAKEILGQSSTKTIQYEMSLVGIKDDKVLVRVVGTIKDQVPLTPGWQLTGKLRREDGPAVKLADDRD